MVTASWWRQLSACQIEIDQPWIGVVNGPPLYLKDSEDDVMAAGFKEIEGNKPRGRRAFLRKEAR